MPYKDPKKKAQYHSRYYRAHQQELLEYAHQYNKKNAKHHRARARRWRVENPKKYKDLCVRNTLLAQKKKDEQVKRELKEQKNLCGLCKRSFTKKDQPVRDHCHKTGKRRALLHSNCNLGIGHFFDIPERCLQAATYLRKWKRLLTL